MADDSYPQRSPAADAPPPAADRRAPFSQIALAILRSLISLGIVVWIYINWDPHFGSSSGVLFIVIGFVLFIAWTAWQGRRIVHATYPGLRAVEVLATVIPLFLIIFAGSYYSFSINDPASFNEVLDKGSAIYFTIVVLSTTGFGDIVPKTGWARSIVNTQMLIDLFFIALVLRFILGSVSKGREMRAQGIPPRKITMSKRRSKENST